jgi:hypothetical protein
MVTQVLIFIKKSEGLDFRDHALGRQEKKKIGGY